MACERQEGSTGLGEDGIEEIAEQNDSVTDQPQRTRRSSSVILILGARGAAESIRATRRAGPGFGKGFQGVVTFGIPGHDEGDACRVPVREGSGLDRYLLRDTARLVGRASYHRP